ncbi:MAG: hypothetical protein RIT43_1085 [Bacteroidota bacterium]|jgi:hypothetical protein
MRKFLSWIVIFSVLLVGIPILLSFNFYSAAKVLGILVVVIFSFSIRLWLHRTKKEFNPRERVKLNLNDRHWMKKDLANYSKLSHQDRIAYEDRIGIFLSNVPIVLSSGKLYADRRKAILLASSFVDFIGFSDDFRSRLPGGVVVYEEKMEGSDSDLIRTNQFHFISLKELSNSPVTIDWSEINFEN